MLALATVGCVIAFVWSKPRAQLPVAVPEVEVRISSEEIKSLVDTYERRRKLTPRLKALETRVQKGKISRRRYKVQRKTLETQLTTLSRRIRDLEEKIQTAGGHPRDLIRRLEIAETEVNEVEANIRSIRLRQRRGELSLGAYRKLLSEYEQRKEKAQTTINEILIRLREETH
jgi:chromosome segregation ATPase